MAMNGTLKELFVTGVDNPVFEIGVYYSSKGTKKS